MTGHRLEFFSAGCPLCTSFEQEVLIGKCRDCRMEVIDLEHPEARARARRYGVRVAPTLVIDARIKVEGRLDEPWMCGDDFYRMLEARYPLHDADVQNA
jgi:hypothetical protein